jgi:hypothetical protein
MSVEIHDNSVRTYYISFTNADDEELIISPPNYLLLDFDGFEQGSVDIQTSKAPYQDGETYIDNIFAKKIITLTLSIFGDTQQEVFDRRAVINQIFNSRLGMGTLEFQQVEGSTYNIDVITKSIKFGNVTSQYHNKVIIELIAPNPFWYDPTQYEQQMIGFSGGFSLPFSFPINFGTVGTQLEVINSGNVETPVLIYFYGEVVNPVITNETTDEAIEITGTISDGDVLIINTAFGEKSVLILSGGEYTNAFEYVNPDSVFWKLSPGANTISYTVSSEGENAQARLYYYHRYSGV